MIDPNYNPWLESFWTLYVRPKMTSPELNQVFCQGPYAGYSIRELINACVMTGRFKMPEIQTEDEDGHPYSGR